MGTRPELEDVTLYDKIDMPGQVFLRAINGMWEIEASSKD